MRIPARASVLAVVGLLGTCVLAQDSVTLRYRPVVGRIYRNSVQVDVALVGGPEAGAQKLLIVQARKIQEITDGTIKVLQTFEYARMAAKQSIPQMGQIADQLKKAKVLTEIDHLGKAVSTKVTGAPNMGGLESLAGVMGEGALGISFSKDPVSVGSKWQEAVDLTKALQTSMGGAKAKPGPPVTVTYTVARFGEKGGRKVAFIEFTMAGAVGFELPGQGVQGQAMGAALTFGGSGQVCVDVLTGLNLASESHVEIGIKITGLPEGAGFGNMTEKLGIKQSLVAPNFL